MRRAFFVGLVFLLLLLPTPARAADATCTTQGSLSGTSAICETDGENLTQAIATAPSGTVYDVKINCVSAAEANVCNNPVTCDAPPGSVLYDVLKSTDNGASFVPAGVACLTNPPAGGPPVITPDLVAERFKAIGWGESPLNVQPPGGRTLVNLETNFFTTNTGPRSQIVTLLGQQVEIEATPTTWLWRHGDGSEQTSTGPGAAYPDLAITHAYLDAEVTVQPSVDTTYTGRYRVNGGPWAAIPAIVTIAGTPGVLDVVPARPQLVAAQ